MKSVAIIGSNGQLGTDLVKTFSARGWEVIPLTHSDIEVTNIDSVVRALKQIKFNWIINTAAFHKVDECEKNSEKAWLVNAKGQQNVTTIANELASKAVYISSDYVFNGNKENPYVVDDAVSPINAYGHSKAGGEFSTISSNAENIVMRISSVFGTAGSSGKGGNFIETILNKARSGEELKVVGDIHMSPTYTVHAARLLEKALTRDFSGLLHGSNSGIASWFDFARHAIEVSGLKTKISKTETEWSNPLKRPRFSALDITQSENSFGEIENWETAVAQYLAEKGYV